MLRNFDDEVCDSFARRQEELVRDAARNVDDVAGIDADGRSAINGGSLQLLYPCVVQADAFATVEQRCCSGLDDNYVDFVEMNLHIAAVVAMRDFEQVVAENIFVVDAEGRDAVRPDEDLRRRRHSGLLEEGEEDYGEYGHFYKQILRCAQDDKSKLFGILEVCGLYHFHDFVLLDVVGIDLNADAGAGGDSDDTVVIRTQR